MQNKKIKNATSLVYNQISFKSKLEVMAYKTLVDNGFKPDYELMRFVLVEGCRPKVPFYTKDKVSKGLKLDTKKLIDITYTPDFTFEYNDFLIIIELKGFQNDTFPIKRKLFRQFLEENNVGKKAIFFEIYTKKQLLQAIEIIKEL